MLLAGMGYAALPHAMMKLISGYYGITSAVAGMIGGGDGSPGAFLRANPNQWISATAFWGAVGLGLLFWAARRRPS